MGTVIAIIYVLGFLYSARKIAFAIKNDGFGSDDQIDRVMNAVMALFAALFWPLGLLAVLVTGKLPKTDAELRAEVAEKNQIIADRDLAIKQLERELGIKEQEHWSNKQFTI